MKFRIIGGGLAGTEAAWGLARRGHTVELWEMRPERTTPAHKTDRLAELVCSNSFRSANPTNAVGLLKREMELLGSLTIRCANAVRVPAGDAFAVDRDRFADAVTAAIQAEERITLHRGEVTSLDHDPDELLIVATGPLTSSPLHQAIAAFLEGQGLYFYDAIAPIVAADSLDMSTLYWKSRYDKGGSSDYLNAAMDREQYERFLQAVLSAELHQIHDFDKAVHFEGCLPIEEIASRGPDTLRFGPMKPVGLEHPETGVRPWAVVQLRREDLSDDYFNIVGFQTKMKIPAQKEVLRLIPGLENAVVARWGSMHRNTFVNGPLHLRATFQSRKDPQIFFAGQISGVEGYVESAASGLLVSRYAAELAAGRQPSPMPFHTAIGALGRHVSESSAEHYQPSNVTWGLIENKVTERRKKERRDAQVDLAIQTVEEFVALDPLCG